MSILGKNIIFICQLVPEAVERSDKRVSNAAQLYQKKFIDFVSPDISISIVPKFVDKDVENFEAASRTYFLNSRFFNRPALLSEIVKICGDVFRSFILLRSYKKADLWFYNLNASTLCVALVGRFILKRRLFVIIADYDTGGNMLSKLVNNFIRKFDGSIILNSNIPFQGNFRVMPGLIREEDIIRPNEHRTLNRDILFSGSLGATTGFPLALEFFSLHPEYNLFISGRPYGYSDREFSSLIERFSQFPNIHYLGQLSYPEYLRLLDRCDLTLSLRDPMAMEHDYNFPSKILEYLSRNKIVVTTKAYKEISPDILFVFEGDLTSFKLVLDKIYTLSSLEVSHLKSRIYDEVSGRFSKEALRFNIAQLTS